jgi:hypothetical protein
MLLPGVTGELVRLKVTVQPYISTLFIQHHHQSSPLPCRFPIHCLHPSISPDLIFFPVPPYTLCILKGSQAEGDNIEKTWWREWSNRQESRMVQGVSVYLCVCVCNIWFLHALTSKINCSACYRGVLFISHDTRVFCNRSFLHIHVVLTSLHCSYIRAGSEPMSDAVVFEPIPYRSALRENCTHIIAVRTRAGEI